MANGPKITVATRNGRFHARIRHGWFDVDGFTAVIIITIIVAMRGMWALVRITAHILFRMIMIASPIVARMIMISVRSGRRRMTGAILAFRAFYVP
jgi:hypothetical protein